MKAFFCSTDLFISGCILIQYIFRFTTLSLGVADQGNFKQMSGNSPGAGLEGLLEPETT